MSQRNLSPDFYLEPEGGEPLTGDEAWKFHHELVAKDEREKTAYLAKKKAEAMHLGKEPFDLEKLLTYYEFYRRTHSNLEYDYYCGVLGQDAMTLKEYAENVNNYDIQTD